MRREGVTIAAMRLACAPLHVLPVALRIHKAHKRQSPIYGGTVPKCWMVTCQKFVKVLQIFEDNRRRGDESAVEMRFM